MSNSTSDESEGSSKKLSYHFGLYRQQIDNRTEEFLRMSKARQIRVGLICAAATTAITVGVVVAILMIYDYAIAIDSSIVQHRPISLTTNGEELAPIADKLDNGIAYFDQETFEKIPFLINDLKDVDIVDTETETELYEEESFESTTIDPIREPRTSLQHKYGLYWSSIRRTSPRPFIFEYKNPAPASFKRPKQISYRSWLQDYRHTQRLRNIEHIINYLKNTVKVKVGDFVPPTKNAAVSGVYVESQIKDDINDDDGDTAASVLTEKLAEAVAKKTRKKVLPSGHAFQADPLHSFKPEHPSDVNMLVDPTLRSSIILKTNNIYDQKTIPMFRPIKNLNPDKKKLVVTNTKFHSKTSAMNASKDKPKLLSVMLDIYPNDEKDEATNTFKDTIIPLKVPQFHPKPTLATGMFGLGPKFPFGTQIYRPNTIRPIYQIPVIHPIMNPFMIGPKRLIPYPTTLIQNSSEPSKMLFHLNLYPKQTTQNPVGGTMSTYYTTDVPNIQPATPIPIPVLYSTTASDFVANYQTTTRRYGYSNIASFLDRNRIINDISAWSTRGPDIIKFNREDAKVPDDYPIMYDRNTGELFQRRTSHELEVEESKIIENNNENTFMNNRLGKKLESLTESTLENTTSLTIRVADEVTSTPYPSTESTTQFDEKTTVSEDLVSTISETTTTNAPTLKTTKEPQINGHYRSINRNPHHDSSFTNKTEKNIEINHTLGIPYKVIERNNRKVIKTNEGGDNTR